jgi:MFS family permease
LAGSPIYEIGQAYPLLSSYYGFLVGPAHTIPTAIFGLVAGSAARTGNTKLIMLGVLGILSGFQFTYGLVDSFALFMLLKVVSQALSAAITPLTFKLLAEHFPPENRTTANSILSSAKMVGIALSSITVLMIKKIGWRYSYCAIGAFGLFGVLAGMIGLKSPKKNV